MQDIDKKIKLTDRSKGSNFVVAYHFQEPLMVAHHDKTVGVDEFDDVSVSALPQDFIHRELTSAELQINKLDASA